MPEASCSDSAARRAAEWLVARTGVSPEWAVVAGSGLSGLGDALQNAQSFPYADIPGMPSSGVHGHAGCLFVGRLGGASVALFAGRKHLYEGVSELEVTFPARTMAAWGVGGVVLTCAAGSLEPMWLAGDLMLVGDTVDWQSLAPAGRDGRNERDEKHGGGRIGEPTLTDRLREAGRAAGIALREGVYASVPGPNYETRAEIRLLRLAGAQAVGMSVVREMRVARAVGLDVATVALLSNTCSEAPRDQPLTHAEVIEAGRCAESRLVALLRATLR